MQTLFCSGTHSVGPSHPTCRASLSSSGPISSPSTCTRFSLSGRFSLCLKKGLSERCVSQGGVLRSGLVPPGSPGKDALNAELVLLQQRGPAQPASLHPTEGEAAIN